MNWINKSELEPPKDRVLLCYCPMWSDNAYQVAKWNGKEFWYEEQPNDVFNSTVELWAIFMEAD